MNSTTINSGIKILLLIILILISFLIIQPMETFAMGGNPVPTVTVINEETGEPIEGAVAIAIWRKHSFKSAWFEGGTMVVVKIEEALSDTNGNIYIEDFWDWHFIEDRYPRLTIYKQGYVCWDQRNIYIDERHGPRRTDFDEQNRVAKMRKWPEGFSFVGHERFVNSVTFGDHSEAPKRLFNKAFHNEIPFASKERDKKRTEVEIDNKRRGVQ